MGAKRWGATILTRKNATRFWIKYFNREKFEDTAPELGWDSFAALHSIKSSKPQPMEIEEEGEFWEFKPDRYIEAAGMYVELDGIVHRTGRQESKTRWRDRVIAAKTGKRILHIDSELMLDEGYWPHVWEEYLRFVAGNEAVGRVYA